MPPFLVVALGAIGAAALAKLIVTETRRVNDALDRRRTPTDGDMTAVPLERDPVTGEYRPRG
ncbi:hypothetical protein ABLE93_00980 [Xanthobacter sp. KR7-65]|uniref:hypothetical protein n=1 Tax=Xanthobacter sp. KR7-65 TaxID=3156612 RepID=UPI0032B51950